MTDVRIIWDVAEDPDGNVQHIAAHGITVEEVEDVLRDPRQRRHHQQVLWATDYLRVHVTWTLSRCGLGTCR